jgi:hypothetical protein
MIESYLNQTATHRVKMSVNEFNEPIFAADAVINCRIEYKRKMVRDKQGQTVVSEASLYTKTLIKPDDVIVFDSLNWPVVSVANQAGLAGSILFYEVSL